MTPLMELTQVSHSYGPVRALSELTVRIEAGAIGLVGQNGAGKSTLMQILLGLIRPTSGTAHVLGLDVRKSGVELRRRVGFMPERNALIPGLNGVEYVALAGELCGMPRRQALRRAHETLSHLGMEDARYRRIDQYSLGMTQRIKLAATLVHDPDLLLLDEPTSGLDPEGRSAMLALLGTLAARPGKSLLLASHLLGDIERVCSSAIILHQGKVVSVGRLSDLKAARQRCYRLRWEGNGESYVEALGRRGVTFPSAARNGEVRAVVPDNWLTRSFFAIASECGALVTGLVAEEEDLEAVYHRLVGGELARDANASAGKSSAPEAVSHAPGATR
ncbi:MAG: ABC transporter ATP-binding protein [Pirellulales bacterium]